MKIEGNSYLRPGRIIAKRYKVIGHLGVGSMGIVYLCRDLNFPCKRVALKVLYRDIAQKINQDMPTRFRFEVLANREVRHPNVVQAYDYIRDGEIFAYTMQFVGGGNLQDKLNQKSLMSIQKILAILGELILGTDKIHECGFIHRDLKPENILFTTRDRLKITDFGIAVSVFGPRITLDKCILGTLDYLSPEYIAKGQVSIPSDIYSIGIIAYEMLTGHSPFISINSASLVDQVVQRLKFEPSSPRLERKDCPVWLDKMVMKALKRDPRARYQSALEMYAALVNPNEEHLRLAA